METLTIQNFSTEASDFSLELDYDADFPDMFVVRGMHPGKRGTLHAPEWHGSVLRFRYDGADGRRRTASLHFSSRPDERRAGACCYRLSLGAQETWQLKVRCVLRDRAGVAHGSRPSGREGSQAEDRERARRGALGAGTRVESDNPLFNDIIARSFLDLHMLRMRESDRSFFAAGVPWYVALFGRDSLSTALEVAAFEPSIGADTLRALAGFQGTKNDDYRDEQPGKIPHEFRTDEMANLGEIPQTPYYGSVDGTPPLSRSARRSRGLDGQPRPLSRAARQRGAGARLDRPIR